jgi:hypothetical protein
MLALDREGFAATVRQGITDYPIIALLTRDANTVLDDEAAAALCNVTTHLVSAVALLSPAARLIDCGHCVPLDRSGPCRVDGTLLIPRTVTFFASVTSKVLAESVADAGRSIVRSLLESAPDDLDRMMFSTNIGVNAAPRGLLHNVRAIEADGVIEPAIDPKLADVVYVAAEMPQTPTLEQREVLISRALPQGTTLAIVKHGVLSGLGPMRIEAVRKGDRVRLWFCTEAAWTMARGAVQWIKRKGWAMDKNRHQRVRAAAIAAKHKNREARWRDILAEARRNVSRDKPAADDVRYTTPVETEPADRMIFKTHVPREVRRPRQRHSERAPAAPVAAPGCYPVPEWQIPWEQWLEAHLVNERQQTREEVENIVQLITEATADFANAVERTLTKLRDELVSAEQEIAKLAALIEESRSGEPLDLPMRSVRELRKVN